MHDNRDSKKNDTKIAISLGPDGSRLFGHVLGSLTVRLSIEVGFRWKANQSHTKAS